MDNDLRLNFISAVVLTLLSAAILVGSLNIHLRAAEPMSSSPALMPGMLGVVLLLTSLLLLRQSVSDVGVRTRAAESWAWTSDVARHPDTRGTLIGIALMAIYTFVLVRVLPFWLASLVFTIALLAFLRATKWYWILVIAGATVGGIHILFTNVFNVPLP